MDENRGTTPGGNDASLRVPPHDLHAEQAVLASVLLNNDLINGVMEVLRPGDFYQGAHRTLYEAMVDLYDRGRPIDQLTLSAVLTLVGILISDIMYVLVNPQVTFESRT